MSWPPREGERVWVGQREKQGLVALGFIISSDRDWSNQDEVMGEVMVEFDQAPQGQGEGQWVNYCDGVPEHTIDWRPGSPALLVWPHKIETRWHGPITGGGDVETYDFAELDGNWSNHENGSACWLIG